MEKKNESNGAFVVLFKCPMPDGWEEYLKWRIAEGKQIRIEANYPFGPLVKSVRLALGYKQAAFADFLGVERQTISKWEHGHCHPGDEMRSWVVRMARNILLVTGEAFCEGRKS